MTADQLAPPAPVPSRAAVQVRVAEPRNDTRSVVGGPACRTVDPEMFFPDNDTKSAAEPAKIVCRRCPGEILASCLRYALTHQVEGIWGATTETDRERIRQVHEIDAEPIVAGDREIRTATVQELTEQEGLSANEIAVRLNVTPRTVVRHRSRLGVPA